MTTKSLIYIAASRCGVLDSQVKSLLIEMKQKHYFNRIILLAGVRKNQNWNDELSSLIKSGIEVIAFKQYPNYSFSQILQKKEFYLVLKRILNSGTIFHIRGESFGASLKNAIKRLNYPNVRILTDIRGAGYEETKIYNKLKPVQHQLRLSHHKKSLKSVNTNSDSISCVSKTLKDYIIKRTGFEENKIYINHCIAGNLFTFSNEERKQYRNKLKLSEKDVLFVFIAGGNSNWQNTEEIISNITDKGYKILNLSRQKHNNPNVISLYVPYSEVSKYLNAADISIIWRNDDVVNNVASPVKFSEYICAGLPVIANEGVHLVNQYIAETAYGKTITDFSELDVDLINNLIKIDRHTISAIAKENFSLKVIAKSYLEIYKRLLEEEK